MSNVPMFFIEDDVIELGPGTYLWCQCGRSSAQPFCDGSHAQPCKNALEVTIDKPQTIMLCRQNKTLRKRKLAEIID
ncbi:MAG: CDGSH iron-sulfur domain-containing protein [Gammaproteobacteria bacterium]|nr:CDGSH iron-sulfur domain-containing protein [Gammaproteobacteria bacterium]